MPLSLLKTTKFKHQQVGVDWSDKADMMQLDPWNWKLMDEGDFWKIPDDWPLTDKDLLWIIDAPDFDGDFRLVKQGGKRFIERVDK